MRKLLRRLRGTPGSGPGKSPSLDASSPPPGALVAAYADVITGGSLIVAFRSAPGRLALRTAPDSSLIPLPAELREEKHDFVSAHVDLADIDALPAGEPWVYDVVLVDSRGNVEHLWLPPTELPTMPAPVGSRQFRVRRGPAGFLKVEHVPLAPAVEILGFCGTEQAVELLLPPDVSGEVLLLDQGRALATFPVRREGRHARATLTAAGLPTDEFPTTTVAVGTPSDWLPIRRKNNGLANPRPSVILPELYGDDPDRPRLRLRYTRHAELIAALVDPRGPDSEEPA